MVKRFDVTSHDDVGVIVLGNGTDEPVLEVGLIGPLSLIHISEPTRRS